MSPIPTVKKLGCVSPCSWSHTHEARLQGTPEGALSTNLLGGHMPDYQEGTAGSICLLPRSFLWEETCAACCLGEGLLSG